MAMRKWIMALAAVCGIAGMMQAQEKYEYNEFYYQRSSLFELLPVGNDDIVFFGNSITNGCEWHELFGDSHIKNRGISSDVIQGLYDRCEPMMKGQPRKVFVMAGVNDVSHNLSPDSIATAMEKLIVRMKELSPRTEIYLQSMLPINNDFRRYKAMLGKEQVIVECNVRFKALAERLGVTWIDLYALFADADGKMPRRYTNDGLHLLGPAYIVWRDAIAKYVK